MKRLLRLEIENFQAHAHTVIDFSDGVTVLCGESNNGKTAVLRALSWLITNRPSGIGFVSHWAKTTNAKGAVVIAPKKKCSVKVSLIGDDGDTHEIERLRTATDNKYIVDGVELSAVGSDVPQNVSDLLGMKEVNRQSQDDGYFFLTLTAGQMAASLNELVHLDTIDTAYGFVHRRKVETNVLLKEAKIAQTETKVALNGLKHVPEMRDMYDEAKGYSEALEDRSETLDGINSLIERLTDVSREMGKVLPDVGKKISRMQALGEDLATAREEQRELSAFIQRVERSEEALNSLPSVSEASLHKMTDLLSGWSKAIEASSDVEDLWSDMECCENTLQHCNDELEGLRKDLPETCPLCGALIGDCRHDRETEAEA